MKKVYCIRQIIVSAMAFCVLIWAFFENKLVVKIIISPFLVCSIAIFFENLFILLNNKKVSDIFKYIFRVSFFIYFFGFLAFSTYYAITNKSYGLFLIIGIFVIAAIYFFKMAFFKK